MKHKPKNSNTVALPWWETEGVWDSDRTGSHEPVAFQIRRGGCREDVATVSCANFSKEMAAQVAAAGENYVETVFFKGFGLKVEREEMRRTKRFFEYLHEHGIKCGVYTQWGSLFTETFFQEVPEARRWVQVDSDGKPVEYADLVNQSFRWRGCPGNADFLAYIRQAIDVAVKYVKADVVYFDNMCLFENHDTLCYCDCCRRGFKRYLKHKYPTESAMRQRLGIPNARDVVPPPLRPWKDHTELATPIFDPLVQEFIEFRCEQLAEAWHATYRYIAETYPGVGLMGNPSFPRKYNERLTSAIDFWRLQGIPCMYYMENAVRNIGTRDGALVSNIRGYKYGRVLDGVRFVPCGSSQIPALTFCEGLAFNDGSGKLGLASEPFFAFFKQHRDRFYRQVAPLTEVAVLRHDVSLTWRWHEAFTVMELAQQAMICAGMPWMPLWGQQLFTGALDDYKVLVVPGCACLSQAEVERIIAFVEQGGGVVILEKAGMLNERHQTLAQWRFAPLFAKGGGGAQFALATSGSTRQVAFCEPVKALSARYGKGRAVYLPQIRQTGEPVKTYAEIGGYDGFQHLQLPTDWQALPKAVEKVAGQPLAARVLGPETVAAEFLRHASGQLLVHLVNYAATPVPAGVQIVLGADAKRAELFVPDKGMDGTALAPLRGRGAGARFRLPAFERYALVVVP